MQADSNSTVYPELESGPQEEDVLAVKMDKRVDVLVAAAFILLGTYVIYEAAQFRPGSFPDPVTSRGVPYFGGAFMILVGAINIARRLLHWQMLPGHLVPSEGSDDEEGHPASALRAHAIAGLAFLWLYLLRDAGYLIVTPVFMVLSLLLMGVRSPWKLLLFPFGFTATIWLVFSQVLGIIIPVGPLVPAFRSWGLVP